MRHQDGRDRTYHARPRFPPHECRSDGRCCTASNVVIQYFRRVISATVDRAILILAHLGTAWGMTGSATKADSAFPHPVVGTRVVVINAL
jgi:hypothetical protein